MPTSHVVVVGAGIVGLAHAWMAALRGHRVTLLERSPRAAGASIRNFGMVWPIGQPAGALQATALRSRARWLEAAQGAGFWIDPCGSLHLAHRDDEAAVVEEFAARAPDVGIECRLLSAAAVLERTPAANPAGLRCGLWSPAECAVDPPEAIRQLPGWLAARYGVECRFATAVTRIERDRTVVIETAAGDRLSCDRAIVAGGADLESLFPRELAAAGLTRCKLQMLRTGAQPDGWRAGCHLASGLTLRHYASFAGCPSLPALRARIARETPELDLHGIHVMIAQTGSGEVILGDSHHYDEAIEPFDSELVESLILRELSRAYRLPEWSIAARWHGIYAKLPGACQWRAEPLPGVHLVTGLGGAGMTMAFGLADEAWMEWDDA